MLNSARDAWEVKAYQPLVLSINNSEAIYKFHCGNLIIMTIIDVGFIEEYIENNGLMVKLLNDSEYMMEVSRIKEDKNKCNTIQVSAHFFGRVSFEFISLTWFLDELIYRIERTHEVADSS
jgi:hypothetical protein